MRVGYSVSKTLTFCGLALVHGFGGFPAGTPPRLWVAPMLQILQAGAWAAVTFCVLRGLPVMVHSVRQYWTPGRSRPIRSSPAHPRVA